MSLVVKNVDHYLMNYVGGTALQGKGAGATVDCYDANSRIGSLSFFGDTTQIPANQLLSDGTLSLYYEMSRFNDVINTLRFEKPLMLAVNTDTGFGYLGSSHPTREASTKVAPYHTTHDEDDPPSRRDVYHDHRDCHYGKDIKPEHRVAGTGGRPRCTRCTELG
jgi:hypothetical protein